MGYLICQKCRGYYKLQDGESPKDFTDTCACGGKLRYAVSIDVVGENKTFQSKKRNNEQNPQEDKRKRKKQRSGKGRERPILSNKDYIKKNRNFNSAMLVLGSFLGAYYFGYYFLVGLILAFLQFYTLSWIVQVSIIFYLILFGFIAFLTGILSFNIILLVFGGLILLNGIIDVWDYKGVRDKAMGLK